MDKLNALKILIDHSYLIYEHSKAVLLGSLERMTAEEIDALGRLLAKEKKQRITQAKLDTKIIDALVEKFQENK